MKALSLVLLAAFLSVGASAQTLTVNSTVFTEDFDSTSVGNQVSGWLHGGTPNWAVALDSTLDGSTPSHVYEFTGSQANLGIGFTPAVLSLNQGLLLSFQYRYSAAPADPGLTQFNFVRFGLYNTKSTATYGDDHGYLADISYWDNGVTSTNKGGDYSLRTEINVFDDFQLGPLLDNKSALDSGPPSAIETGDILTMLSDDGINNASSAKDFVDGTSIHTAAIAVILTSEGILAVLFHDDLMDPVVIGLDTSGNLSAFDRIYLEGSSDVSSGFFIDNVTLQEVSYSAVPEPSACAIALGGIVFVWAGNRRRSRPLAA